MIENKLSKAEEAFIEKITEHLDRTTEEVKEALGRNRQQRKQYIKDQEKKRRAIRNLTPIQVDIMKEAINREKEKMERWVANNTMSFYSSVNSVLYSDFNFSGEQTKVLWDKVENLIDEDQEARKQFSQKNEEEWRRMEQKVNEFIKKELKAGSKQKEIVEKLKKEFPKLSTAMRVNAVKEMKEEWNEASKKITAKEVEKRQVKADEEIKVIKEEEKMEKETHKLGEVKSEIKQDVSEVTIKAGTIKVGTKMSILEQLKKEKKAREEQKELAAKELEELKELIAAKEKEISKVEEEIRRIDEAGSILGPINI